MDFWALVAFARELNARPMAPGRWEYSDAMALALREDAKYEARIRTRIEFGPESQWAGTDYNSYETWKSDEHVDGFHLVTDSVWYATSDPRTENYDATSDLIGRELRAGKIRVRVHTASTPFARSDRDLLDAPVSTLARKSPFEFMHAVFLNAECWGYDLVDFVAHAERWNTLRADRTWTFETPADRALRQLQAPDPSVLAQRIPLDED